MVSPYDNVQATVEDGELVVRCNVADVKTTISKSGKSDVYATTGGAVKVPDGNGGVFSVNMTVYRPR